MRGIMREVLNREVSFEDFIKVFTPIRFGEDTPIKLRGQQSSYLHVDDAPFLPAGTTVAIDSDYALWFAPAGFHRGLLPVKETMDEIYPKSKIEVTREQ